MNPSFREYFPNNNFSGVVYTFVILLCTLASFHLGSILVFDTTDAMGDKILSADFEVFGKVQGVFFRKNTVLKGTELALRGWCMNTHTGTVKGHMEGPPKEIEEMKHWLRFTGSKMSRIDKAEFSNEKEIDKYTLSGFSVRH